MARAKLDFWNRKRAYGIVRSSAEDGACSKIGYSNSKRDGRDLVSPHNLIPLIQDAVHNSQKL